MEGPTKGKILVTGSSNGIGKAIAELFLSRGLEVVGLDIEESTIHSNNYEHYVCDVSKPETLPDFVGINILINNAGVQTASEKDIEVNLKGAINVTEKYLKSCKNLESILFIGSVSAHSGFEFPEYVASKAGLVGYMKNVAMRVAKKGVTCNSLDPGGVMTDLNKPVMSDPKLWKEIMDVTPLKRWATPEEIAEWAFFLTYVQSFCTGQTIVVDGGEKDLNGHFVWPGFC